ncbi:UNVERIFIED_CONTAM: hypothetical protein Sradi_4401100 [Sesamum radiatum]|uniref:Uncharacterized protein n=1 Tax=Sesamum radiatum TaxID=300843 RepID=A0AAW2NS64_SESRA
MYALTRKLKNLKPVFRAQRKRTGDLSVNVDQAKAFLCQIQLNLENDQRDELLLQLEKVARLVLLKATTMEQNMLHQRAKIQWLKGGDQCTRIFFRRVTARRAKQRIFQIRNAQGEMLMTEEAIATKFMDYYTNLLGDRVGASTSTWPSSNHGLVIWLRLKKGRR